MTIPREPSATSRPNPGTAASSHEPRFGPLLADLRASLRTAMDAINIVAGTTHWDPLQSNSLWLLGVMETAALAIDRDDTEAANAALRELRNGAGGTGFLLTERAVRDFDDGFAPTTPAQLDDARRAWRSLVKLLRS